MKKRAAVVSGGWLGDTIACTAAAASLSEKGYKTTFYMQWPQLKPILDNDERFVTKLYGRFLTNKIQRPIFRAGYDVVVLEPKCWTYDEPFTSEIRRIAGCEPKPEYSLRLSEVQKGLIKSSEPKVRPLIAVARDTYKRAYGRDVDGLVNELSSFADVRWVGLNPDKDSKKGKNISLVKDASLIYNADLFIGTEGGLLWVAAGLGKQCVYFTEYILDMDKSIQRGHPCMVLGSRHHFPDASHIDLPAYCSNDYVVKTITDLFENQQTA